MKARDRQWKEIKLTGEGLFGQALQHEIDHLDGKLYIDRLESLDALQRIEPLRPHQREAREDGEHPEQEARTVEEPRLS